MAGEIDRLSEFASYHETDDNAADARVVLDLLERLRAENEELGRVVSMAGFNVSSILQKVERIREMDARVSYIRAALCDCECCVYAGEVLTEKRFGLSS